MVSPFRACFGGGGGGEGERARRRVGTAEPESSLESPRTRGSPPPKQRKSNNFVHGILKSTAVDAFLKEDVLGDILPDLLRDVVKELFPGLLHDVLPEILPGILKKIVEEVFPSMIKQILKESAGTVLAETLRPSILKDLPSASELVSSVRLSGTTVDSIPEEEEDSDEGALQAERLAESLALYMSRKRFRKRSKSRGKSMPFKRQVSFGEDTTTVPSSPRSSVRNLSRSNSGDASSRGLWYEHPEVRGGLLSAFAKESLGFVFLWTLAPFVLWYFIR